MLAGSDTLTTHRSDSIMDFLLCFLTARGGGGRARVRDREKEGGGGRERKCVCEKGKDGERLFFFKLCKYVD